ncbi:hypothetical protein CDD83_5923 [Cordyceps sp. RAO-2017]|nr:hypothetical protein CDD83_5923 [Cordyceps sp. RAO-2017]
MYIQRPVFWSQMLRELDITQEDLNVAQALQLVGTAVGCILLVPFAKKYGRRPTYIISVALVTGATLWSAYMTTATEIILSNVLMGLAGATNETATQMSIRDMFFVHQRGSANGLYLIAIAAGAFLAPMAAGIHASISGWRSSYFLLGYFMIILLVLFILTFEETKYVPAPSGTTKDYYGADSKLGSIEYEASVRDKIRQRPPFPRYLRLQLITRTNESLWKTFFYPIHAIWYPHIIFTYLEFASGVCWFVVVSSIAAIVFARPPYSFNPAQVGLMFGGPLIGSLIGSLYGGLLVDWAIIRFAIRNKGIFEPEMRLWLVPVPALAMSAGLVIFGVTADRFSPKGMHWAFPSIGGGLFAFGFGGISDISFTLVIDSFPNIVAQSFVVIAFFRNTISIAGPFSISPWLEAMSVSEMFITAGCISLGIHLTALPLVFWGKRARAKIAPHYQRLAERATSV